MERLRDITNTLKTQGKRLYHLGMMPPSRATLARMNEHLPAAFYENPFDIMLNKCQTKTSKHQFSLKSKLYLFGATVVDLSRRFSLGRVSSEKEGSQITHRSGCR